MFKSNVCRKWFYKTKNECYFETDCPSPMKQILYTFLLVGFFGIAQQPSGFTDEVNGINKKYDTLWDKSKKSIVFTGSSSIRMWKTLNELFPEQQILNTGFGGSQAIDLLHHLEPLVLKYNPKKVFIYEGDNDLWAKKKPKEIVATTWEIINKIHSVNPNTPIVLIGTKPSISRWKLRGRYKRLNKKLEKVSKSNPNLTYVDVWYPMLNRKKLKKDIFISDGLHMNQKGYDIWYETMKELVNQP